MRELIITDRDANQRLDKFLQKYFNKAPKSLIYKLLRKKRIKYNGAKAEGNEIIQKGGIVGLYLSDGTMASMKELKSFGAEAEISFKKLYEDRNVLIVEKPPGLLSQKGSGVQGSLVEQVSQYLWENGEYNPEAESAFSPALCNRLDRNTSGIVIIGKSVAALQELGKALQNGNISKHYLTLVKGSVKYGEKLQAFLIKDSKTNTVTVTKAQTPFSKPIITVIAPIVANDKYTYLDVSIKTGRPHQIRAHLAFAGFPVVGDKKYGHKGTNLSFLRKYGLNRQLLHSYKICFENMEGDFSYLNGKEVCSALPEDLSEIIENTFS